MTPPRLVLDPGADLAAAMRGLERDGWRVQHGFAVPGEPWDLAPGRVVLAGDVASGAAAQAVLMAAVRGAGLAVRLDRNQPWAAAFLTDVARLEPPQVAPEAAALTPEQRQLLDLLAGGASITQAARQLYLSLRTANRRVATAREALGVASTREAVMAYVRMRGG